MDLSDWAVWEPDFWNRTFLDNSLMAWGIALGVFLGSWFLMRVVRAFLAARFRKPAERRSEEWPAYVYRLILSLHWPALMLFGLYFGSLALALSDQWSTWRTVALKILVLYQVALFGDAVVKEWAENYEVKYREASGARITSMRAFVFLARLAIYSVLLLTALNNIPGVDVTTLLASLGVGGIAVALALQNILSDLFASLSISIDQPFVIGDFIIVGDLMGTVEHIGLKTTRIRSLSGEQLVFSNNDLLGSRIRNYKRMRERRIVFGFGITYDTPYEKLERVPGMVREIVEAQDKVRFDRAHFQKYGDSSLDFEVVYYVLDPDYNLYMDIQQAMNLALFKRFEDEGIEFAFPTRTLHLASAPDGVQLARREPAKAEQ